MSAARAIGKFERASVHLTYAYVICVQRAYSSKGFTHVLYGRDETLYAMTVTIHETNDYDGDDNECDVDCADPI